MKIAYVLNTYPQPSQSFIRREIHALERAGFEVERIAMRRFDGVFADPLNLGERERTHYVLEQPRGALIRAALSRLLRAPRAFGAALALAWRMGRTPGASLFRHLIYLIEAAHVAERCLALDLHHVHCHFGTNAPAVGLLAQALGGPQFSFTVHGPEEFDAPGALNLPIKLARAAFTVAVSQFGRSQLCRWADFGVWDRIKVVHCGIEPHVFDHVVPMPELPPLRIVTIGRFVEQKGQMILVQALARLRESHPEIRLVLVGDGAMRPDIEAAIAQHGLTDRVVLTGWADETRVNRELAESHVLAMPSFAEGLPVAVMEAMASGRPVLSTYVAGIPELVTPEVGRLVPAGDVGAMARALAELSETSPEHLARMGQAGRFRVLERHDIDTEAGKLAGHIRDAVSQGRTGA